MRMFTKSTNTRDCYDDWYKALRSYTYRSLTFNGDRLPAASSLAAVAAARTGDEYIARLWKGDLYNGLLWNRPIRAIRGDPAHPF